MTREACKRYLLGAYKVNLLLLYSSSQTAQAILTRQARRDELNLKCKSLASPGKGFRIWDLQHGNPKPKPLDCPEGCYEIEIYGLSFHTLCLFETSIWRVHVVRDASIKIQDVNWSQASKSNGWTKILLFFILGDVDLKISSMSSRATNAWKILSFCP